MKLVLLLSTVLLAHGWWFSPGTPASSTTRTGRHDIAEILLKVVLNTKNQIKSFCCLRFRRNQGILPSLKLWVSQSEQLIIAILL